jgi:hypothetical protein
MSFLEGEVSGVVAGPVPVAEKIVPLADRRFFYSGDYAALARAARETDVSLKSKDFLGVVLGCIIILAPLAWTS